MKKILLILMISSPVYAMRRLARIARRPLAKTAVTRRAHHADLTKETSGKRREVINDLLDTLDGYITASAQTAKIKNLIEKLEKNEENKYTINGLQVEIDTLERILRFNREKIETIIHNQ